MTKKIGLGALAGIIAIALCGTAQAQTAQTPPAGDTGSDKGATDQASGDNNQLGDIIVTAQRTNQRLQDVPVSVTALSSADLDRKQITSALDLSNAVPNVKFDTGTGGTTSLKPFIRGGGVTDGGFVLSESEVAIYVDDVYQARLSSALVDFAVLDRIEVLRGPQGVLYGRNASAGAVNFITKAPAADQTGMIELGYGTFNERRAKGYFSTPLTADSKWRLSVNGLIRARDGGAQYNETLKKKVGANSFEGGQADLAYDGDVVQGRLTGFYAHTSSDGQYPVNTILNDAGTAYVPISGSYRKVLSPDLSYTHSTDYGVRLHLSADYPGGTLKSITGYQHMKEGWFADLSGGVPASLLGQDSDEVFALFERNSNTTQHQFSEELQAAGKFGDLIDYVTGVYYFHEASQQDASSKIFNAPSSLYYQPNTNSFAGYAQATVHFTPKLSAIVAGRYTIDDKKLVGTINGESVRLHNSYEKFTPKFGLNYKVTPDILAYASYSVGFKGGGYNGLASTAAQLAQPFRPEVTDAYEAGLKTDWFDHHLRVNVAGFVNKIKDRQQTVNLGNGGFLIENYDVTIKGIELEATAHPLAGLSIYGNGALNWGKYTGTDSAVASILHNTPPSLPDYQFTAGFDYSIDVGPGKLGFGADYTKRDSYFSTPDNSLIGFVLPQEFLNGYVSYEVGKVRFQVTGKNLLQQLGAQTGFGFSVVNPQTAIEPRTVLGTVRYSF